MENKSNRATPLRPEGDRALSGNLVEMDLEKSMHQIKSEKTWLESSHNSITLLKSEQMRIVFIGMHEGAVIRTHEAKAVISVQVLKGKITFTAEDREILLHENQMLALLAQLPHSVRAESESFFLLTMAATV